MKTREDIILDMCYTWRHDFGIEIESRTGIQAGMTSGERHILRRQMEQLFDNCIAPHMEFKQ